MLTAQQIATLLDLPGIGKKSVQKILNTIEPQHDITNPSELYDLLEIINKKQSITREDFFKVTEKNDLLYEKYQELNIEVITREQKRYPELLKKINDPPLLLYVKGSLEALIENPTVAVIGTREPTEYGKRIGNRIAEILAENKITIVSGLAKGCDTIAHKGALNKNGLTVGVLAHGLQKIYPKENERLAYEMIDMGGCLITEYALGIEPFKNYFVERDRIQSGLSYATLVIETGIKGGTMHTVNYTLDQERLLYVIEHPADKRTEKSEGNYSLLKQGIAKGLSKPEDVSELVEEIMKRYDNKKIKDENREQDHKKIQPKNEMSITEKIKNESEDDIKEKLTINELALKFKIKVSTIQKHIDDKSFTTWMKKKDKARSWQYDEKERVIYTKDGDLFIN